MWCCLCLRKTMHFGNLHCVTELYTEHDSSTSQNWVMSILDCFSKISTISSKKLEWWRDRPLPKMPHVLDEETESHGDGMAYLWGLKSAPCSRLCYQPHHWHWRLLVRWRGLGKRVLFSHWTSQHYEKKNHCFWFTLEDIEIQGDFIFIHVQSVAHYL